jgi:hypothetical protein
MTNKVILTIEPFASTYQSKLPAGERRPFTAYYDTHSKIALLRKDEEHYTKMIESDKISY